MGSKFIKLLLTSTSILILFTFCTNPAIMNEQETISYLKEQGYEEFGYTLDKNKEYVIKIRIEKEKSLTSFPEELRAFKQLKAIELLDCNVTEVPEFITEFEELEKIFLDGNPIEELPDYLVDCKKLTTLSLYNTQVNKLPKDIGTLPISWLYLKGSNIEGFPKVLYEFDSLTSFSLNLLDELPSDISSFQYLVHINIPLKSFKYVETIETLSTLSLDESTGSHLPKDIGNLQNLEHLHFRECKNLITLPPSIGKIKKLWGLDLRGCSKLQTLPKGLENVDIGIIHLDRCTSLRSVPKGLKVGSISAYDTQWKSMPTGIFHSEAHNLDVINHQITNIEGIGNMYNLSTCNLSNGKIKYIPNGIGKLKNLYSLTLQNNLITEVNPAVRNCPKLDGVGLFGNPIYDMSDLNL